MGYDLFNQRDGLIRSLSESINMMKGYGISYAEAECAYKEELAKTAVRLKDNGMTATMVNLTIHGTGEVPKLRMKRDVAEVMYKTAQEKIQSDKLQLRLIESQIDREWSQSKRTV